MLGIDLLRDREVEIDGARFLGSTLWTDYELYGDPATAMRVADAGLNDHRLIFPTHAGHPLSPHDALEWHQRSLGWLSDALIVPFAGPSVVVTHHLPHLRSIHPRFSSAPLTPAFCSDLTGLVENSGAAVWVHGHTHTSSDYLAGQTRVVCNPKGYGPVAVGGRLENPDFERRLIVHI